MIDWFVRNYQLVGAIIAAVFGAGTVIGRIGGRLKSLERRVEAMAAKQDKITDHLAVIKDRLCEVTKNKEWYWR